MKTALFIISFLSINLISFCQNSNYKAISQNSKDLILAKKTGNFSFNLPNEITKEKVLSSATYYTSFFKVDFNEKSNSVNISMIDNNEMNRRIILRFFTILNIQQIISEGREYALGDFYNSFLN